LGLPRDKYSQQGPYDNIWINDHLIYTNLMVITKEKTELYGYRLHNPAIFDPFTGTWHQELIEALPDDDISRIAFSSDMQRALYYKAPDRLVLWNLMENEAIWEYQKSIRSVSSIEIKWAPDDSMVLIANMNKENTRDFEIFLLSRDGKVEQKIASRNYPIQRFYPIYIEWSPNSRFVALSSHELFDNEVYIYDVNSKGYLYRCPFNSPGNMVWSPDSRYLAMGEGYESLRILDIEKEEVIELIPFGIPAGWSATFPVDWKELE
jgi:WD40 repeat protein